MLSIIPVGDGKGRNGGGRQKGTPNKVNADIRAMILEALDDVGGPRYLSRQAIENPSAFMSLLGRILPTSVSNVDGSPIALHLIAAQLVSQHIIDMKLEPTSVQTDVSTPTNLLDAPPPTE